MCILLLIGNRKFTTMVVCMTNWINMSIVLKYLCQESDILLSSSFSSTLHYNNRRIVTHNISIKNLAVSSTNFVRWFNQSFKARNSPGADGIFLLCWQHRNTFALLSFLLKTQEQNIIHNNMFILVPASITCKAQWTLVCIFQNSYRPGSQIKSAYTQWIRIF